jgi:peptidoglycan hydrolase-like protein with peptidoglycan-binding domain
MSSTAPRHRRRRWRWIVVGLFASVGTVAAWAVVDAPPTAEVGTSAAPTRNSTQVVRTTLRDVTVLDGTLGYVEGAAVVNRAVGTLTSVPDSGAIIRFGDVLYTVNTAPVVLLEGGIPMYRDLQAGDEGPDVEQLEIVLVSLGYDPDGHAVIDEEFDDDTEEMVQRWQEAMGIDATGQVSLGDVVFLPEPIRVASVNADVGEPVQSGFRVITTSGSTTVVSVRLDARDQGVVSEGDAVAVVLPDESSVPATVTSVGTVAIRTEGDGSFFEVEVTLDERGTADGLDEAPVSVEVVTEEAVDVLAIPVGALLALSEGGYAVEVLGSDGSTRLVRVEGAMFADGLVEVSGQGISEGTSVVLP